MITYKRTTASDPDFQKLIVELDKEFWIRYPDTQQNFVPFNNVDGNARVTVAYDAIIPIGCGCFRQMKEMHTIEIKRMYVVPAYRNRGIGKIILTHLEQWAKEENFKISKLETGIKQPEAIAAYKKSGYIHIPNYPPYVDMQESICMMKNLQ
jgi:GNAT superfamily N-acetyltransferase